MNAPKIKSFLGTEHTERTEYTDFSFMLIHEDLTKGILAAFYEVHHTLGFGFLENVYQNALYKELTKRGYKCECQKDITVYYKGETVGVFRADMVVNDIVILELKAVSDLRPEHEWQLVNYLKATGIEIGLLLNFGVSAQHKRKIFTKGYIKRT